MVMRGYREIGGLFVCVSNNYSITIATTHFNQKAKSITIYTNCTINNTNNSKKCSNFVP